MEKPVLFLTNDPVHNPLNASGILPQLPEPETIHAAHPKKYICKTGGYTEEGLIANGSSVYKYDINTTEAQTWLTYSEEPRTLLVYMLSKDVACSLSGYGRVTFKEGYCYLLYLPPGITHKTDFSTGHTQVIHVNLVAEHLRVLIVAHGWVSNIVNHFEQRSSFGLCEREVHIKPETYLQIDHLFNFNDEPAMFILFIRARVMDMLREYVHELSVADGEKKTCINRPFSFYEKVLMARTIIERTDVKISVRAMAQRVKLSRSDLQKGFSEMFHHTFDKYQVKIRMGRAANILINKKNISVNDVSRQFGYDESSFIKRFKTIFTLTPLQYRKKYGKY